MPNYRYTDNKVFNGDASMELDWWNDIGDVEVVDGGISGSNGRLFRIGPNSSMWQTFDDPNFTPSDIRVSGYVYLNNNEQELVEALIKYTIYYLDGTKGRYAVPLRINLANTVQGTIEGTSVTFYYFEDTLACDEDKKIDYLRIDIEVGDMSNGDEIDDPYTVLLLHMNGAQDSTDFIDSSLSEHIFTPNGAVKIDTSFYRFGGASGSFGTSKNISTPDSDAFHLGADDFTIECFLFPTSLGGYQGIMSHRTSASSNHGWAVGLYNSKLFFSYTTDGTTNKEYTFDTVLLTNQWYHLAWVRRGDTLYGYVNGLQQLTTVNIGTDTIFNSSEDFYVGKFNGGNQPITGYLDEIRLSKGIARWGEDFIPPVREYNTKITDPITNTNYMFLDDIAVNFNLGTTKSYGKNSEALIIDEYGLNTNYLKNFKNMVHNSQFEAYDADTLQPFYWTCSDALVKTTASAAFFATRSLQIPAGQHAIYDGTGVIDPHWYDSQLTRVSFYARSGTVRVELWDYSNPGTPVRFTLTDEAGYTGLYKDYTFADWHAGTGNSASRATVSFNPGSSTDVRIKFSNVGVAMSYIDGVILEPDFTKAWPSMYTDGPYSLSAAGIGIYVQDDEPTGYIIKKGTLWLKTSTKRWYFWDGSGWQITAGGGGEGVPGLYSGEPCVVSEVVDYSDMDTSVITTNDLVDTAVVSAISLNNLIVLLLHFNGNNFTQFFTDSSTYPKNIQGISNPYTMGNLSKYGAGSIYLDGTGDYITTPDHADFDFGAGDFTIETWIYPWTNLLSSRHLYNQYGASGTYCCYWTIDETSGVYTMLFRLSTSGANATSYSCTIPVLLPNTWYHLAVVRKSNFLYFFVDGNLYGYSNIGAVTLFNSSQTIVIGANTGGTEAFGGWLDDYRVTKGLARYFPNAPSSTEDFEDTDYTPWSITGDWDRTTVDKYAGTYSFASTNQGQHNTSSSAYFAITLTTTKWISLWYKVSSETADKLYIYLDGVVVVNGVGGAGSWAQVYMQLSTGDHTIECRYTKDGSINTAADTAYIDNIEVYDASFTPASELTSDANTSLLLSGNGTHGSNTISDSSGTTKTMTSVGNTINWNSPQKFGTGCLWLTAGAYLQIAHTTDMDFAANNFTIHCWITPSALPAASAYMTILGKCYTTTAGLSWLIEIYNNAGTYRFSIRWSYNGTTTQQQITNYAFTIGTRYHIAVVRNGTNLVSYVNGVTLATTAIGTNAIFSQTDARPLLIGAFFNGTSAPNQKFAGWLDELIIERSALWTADFTPPVAEY